MTDYQEILQTNPVVQFSPSGYQKARWFNYVVTSTASVKSFQVFVYGNLKQDATQDAIALKRFFEASFNANVSIGILSAKLDPTTSAYVVQMNMNVGALYIPLGSPNSQTTKQTIGKQQLHNVDVVNNTTPVVNNGVQTRN